MITADSAAVRSIEELLERLARNPTPVPPRRDPAGLTQAPAMPIKPIPLGQPIQTAEIRSARQVMEQRLARLLTQAAELIEKLKGGESA